MSKPEAPSVPRETTLLDTVIRINRSVRVSHSSVEGKIIHPELETVGPSEYDLAQVELYLHDKQKGGKKIKGEMLYKHLKETDSLKNCLGLEDALEIQKKGFDIVRKLFGSKILYCMKSATRSCSNRIIVPCVYAHKGKVEVYSFSLHHYQGGNRPVVRFPN